MKRCSESLQMGIKLNSNRDKLSLVAADVSIWSQSYYVYYFSQRVHSSQSISQFSRVGHFFFFSRTSVATISSLTSPQMPMISHCQLWQLVPSLGITSW